MLTSVGFAKVLTARSGEEILNGVAALRTEPKSALIIYVNQGSREDLGRPTIGPEQNKINMMRVFRGENQ